MKRCLFSLLLTGAMLLSMCPPGLALAADSGGLCPHHQEHSYEVCGYIEAVEEIPCNMDCAEIGEDGQIIHAEGCAYTPAVTGQPCGYVCPVCPVQAMIDALPDAEGITLDNRAEVEAQLEAIDTARARLTDEETGQIDFSRHQAAVDALLALDGQAGADVPMPAADGDVTYLYCDANGQNWQTGTKASGDYAAVTASDTTWGTENATTWYVASGDVTIGTEGIPQRIEIDGNVHLILEDGCNLMVNGGIHVKSQSSLCIYGQSETEQMGTLIAEGAEGNNFATGIGGNNFESSGEITIYGGNIRALGRLYAAGIGGAQNGGLKLVKIHGGVIQATGGRGNTQASGIGQGVGSNYHGDGVIMITGGTITATGCGDKPGIGDLNAPQSTAKIKITGGTVMAIGQDNGAYGKGNGIASQGNLEITGDAVVYATAGSATAIRSENKANTENWNGIVFEKSNGTVYGNTTLTEDLTIENNQGLTIPAGSVLTIPQNTTLTNNGTLTIDGTLTVNGALDNKGTLKGNGNITPDTAKLTPDAPRPGVGYIISYTAETITAASGYEVSSEQNSVTPPADIPGKTLYVRKAGNNFYNPSSWTSLTINDRPATPSNLRGVNTSFAGESDGIITGLTAQTAYQIFSDSGNSWEDKTSTDDGEITGLAAGKYQVRVKATTSTFASEAAPVTVGSGDEKTYTLTVTAPIFDAVTYGYTQPTVKAITISSSGNSNATISSVTVSGSDFTIGGSGGTVMAGGFITSWTVQPNAGLSVGEHTATITVTYDGGATATATVSFKVNGAAQDAPANAPELDGKTYNSVTLKAVENNANGAAAEYSKDNGQTWQDSPVFTGLSPSTKYTFVVRYGTSGNYEASPASSSTEITTEAAPVTMYSVTVNGGTGGGSYVAGDTVTITATVPSGQRFTGWTVNEGGVTLANASSATTTFTMPAQAVTVTANFQSNSGGGSFGGGGGGSYTPPTYPPTVERPSEGGGAAAISPSNPERGDTVTVTPKPDQGYEVDQITITDQNGKPVEVKRNPDGTYTFTQPTGKVKIEVTYKPVQPVETPWNNPFTDISEGDWYYEAVRFVHERGLMNGYSDSRFGPNDPLSRAQLAQILFNKEGRPVVNYLMGFSDVADEAWYAEAVRWATSQGIVSGYGNGRFGPNDPITREQLAVMLWRYSGSPAATNKELHFNDTDEISGYALEALRWAVENGILNGYGDGRLGPQGQATRAQAAQMLKNFIENMEAKP